MSYFKKNTKIITLCLLGLFCAQSGLAASLSTRLTGRILLQIQSKGQAWYVNPADQKRYDLGRPDKALAIMSGLGVGITNADLAKIPVGIINNPDAIDSDNDGLPDNLEMALDTNPNNSDSDNDGYDDKTEIENNYNPAGFGRLPIDNDFTKKNLGKIFLQIEKNGEAWYIEPMTKKRYFLSRPADAFRIMKNFGLGITDADLEKITIGLLTTTIITPPIVPPTPTPGDNIIYSAANAIRAKNKTLTASYFIPEMKKSIEYNLDNMSDESILALGNILSGSKLTSSTDSEKIYSNDVYFSLGNQYVHLDFIVKKQSNGAWLMTNL